MEKSLALLFLDIDECENSNPCGSNGTCSNSVFPFQCNCIDGFEQQPQTSTGLYGFICGGLLSLLSRPRVKTEKG